MHRICYYNCTLRFQHTVRLHLRGTSRLLLLLSPTLRFYQKNPPMDQPKPRAAPAEEGSALARGGGRNYVPQRFLLRGQRRASGAVFPVVAASNEVNTVIEVNSSTDMKKEATGSAAGGVWEQRWEPVGWRAPGQLRSLGPFCPPPPIPGVRGPVASPDELGSGTSRGGDARCR